MSSAWKTIAKVNASKFNPGDQILLKRGETWREQLTVPSSGTFAQPITFGAYGIGIDPVIDGTDLVTTWTEQSGNIWRTSLRNEPWFIMFDDVVGKKKNTISSLLEERDWYWTPNILFVRSSSDPGITYTNLGVRAATRAYCIFADDKHYVVYKDLMLYYAGFDGLRHENANQITAINLYAKDNGKNDPNFGEGLSFAGITNLLVQNCQAISNGWNGISITRNSSSVVVEDCHTHHNGHQGLDFKAEDFHDASMGRQKEVGSMTDVTVRYSLSRENQGYGIYFEDDDEGHISDVKIYYNVLVNNGLMGLRIHKGDGNAIATVKIYNNTIYGNGVNSSDWEPGIEAEMTNGIMNNNIIFNNQIGSGSEREIRIVDNGGAANISDYNLIWNSSNLKIINWNNAAYTFSEFQKIGQESHGISRNPICIDEPNGDFRLLPSSPCVDAGTGLASTRDFSGTPVPDGKAVDIGAFEFRHVASPKNLLIDGI
jgi:hypothetical protein